MLNPFLHGQTIVIVSVLTILKYEYFEFHFFLKYFIFNYILFDLLPNTSQK
jgi:hypothetical protein